MINRLKLFLFFSTLFASSCNRSTDNLSLKGNWHSNLMDGKGIYMNEDTLTNYCEYYISDTTIIQYEEWNGRGNQQRFYIKSDSIYKCLSIEPNCNYIPMYLINVLSSDTIQLIVNPKYANGIPNRTLIRLPLGEKGIYDHVWTTKTADSLEMRIKKDFDRRRWKFYSIRAGDMTGYDSAIKAGHWN